MRGSGRFWLAIIGVCGLLPAAAPAQTPGPVPEAGVSDNLPTVTVIGTTPLPGTGIDADKVPANVQNFNSTDLQREGTPSVLRTLNSRAGSVNINENLGDPFQPDLLYRGFEASPVLGTPQGIAVYQNGVRINEAFGDTVNWDLFPDVAIDRLDVFSSNPVYGLNALGGAVVLTMKNGFTYQGFETELAGGSFGQRSLLVQYGQQAGNFSTYLAGRLYESNGWREFSPNSVKQLYTDLAARGERATLDISFTGANNRLFGIGPSPVQELAVNRALVFTRPQFQQNELEFVTLNGSYELTDTLSLQLNAYRREFRQDVQNGNTSNFVACTSGSGLLCQSDGTTPLVGPTGAPIPDISQGGTVPVGENDREFIRTVTWGATLQSSSTKEMFGRPNNLVVGGSFDYATTDFRSSAEIGIIDPNLLVQPGFFVTTPENTGFNATPVSLGGISKYYGLFATDTFDLTSALSLTLSGRYNLAFVDLVDRLGSNLSGNNRYSHFNPAVGFAYKIAPTLTAYFGFSEGNRAPTPSEIECSNPAQPCLLPSSLTSDPPTLKQVISKTYEAGLRGNFNLPSLVPGRFIWNFGLFRTDLGDDILGIATSLSTGFFQNVGSTRRQGIESGLSYRDERWSVDASYSLVDATFQTALTVPSPSNPLADANGDIHVMPGDRLPGIPLNRLKLAVDYRVTPQFTIGGTIAYFSDQFFKGDEANQNPALPGYVVANLHASYRPVEYVELFANIQNVFNRNYATFGTFGDPTGIGTPGIPPGAVTNGPGVDNRFISPAPPISVFGGVRVKF